MRKRNIVLVGFMGTGKTTVGRLLAEQTGMPLVDMDTLLADRAGKSISRIFAEDGEATFRRMEHALACELAKETGQIISTGGGIVLDPTNLQAFEQNSLIVCLLADATTVLERVRGDDSRPLLEGDKAAQIARLLDARKPLYEAIPHRIDTSGRPSPLPTAEEIIALYESNCS